MTAQTRGTDCSPSPDRLQRGAALVRGCTELGREARAPRGGCCRGGSAGPRLPPAVSTAHEGVPRARRAGPWGR